MNADSREEREAWFEVLNHPTDTVVFSPNLHEIRGYNRLAGLAKGDVVVLLQARAPGSAPASAQARSTETRENVAPTHDPLNYL